jgi:glycosyltransferase involved in cell wall biosynthesis
MPNLISVIVSTYDRADALDMVLRALSRQCDRQFEVLVADDGSGPQTAALVETWKPRFAVGLAHVWQEHHGFRLAEIRDLAILASRGDYCIFLDGDCIVRPDFVATHRRLAERGWFVTGNRVLLSSTLTAAILRENLEPETWGLGEWIEARRRGDINRLAAVLHLPLGPLRKLGSRQWRGARSCNLAVWRTDLEATDGFDASFQGWGLEDSDVVVRLLHAGIRRKDGRFATGALHLWHAEVDRGSLAANQARLDAAMRDHRVRAERGLSALRETAKRDGAEPMQAGTDGRDARAQS